MKKLLLLSLNLLLALNLFAQSTGVSPLVDGGGDKIIKKTGQPNWAKVYKRKVKSTVQFLWFTTDSLGNKLNRGGQLKNTSTYSSLTTAEATLPSGYAEVVIPPNPNSSWETTTLPGLIAGTSDITTYNTMGLSVFPSTPVVPSGTLKAQLWWGDAALFRGNAETIKALGLATAFDHNRMFSTTTMPLSERYTWNIASDTYASHSLAQVEIDGASEYNLMFGTSGTRRDKNNNVIKIPRTHWDIETAAWPEDKSAAFIKGFHNAAIADNPDYVTIVYGKPTIRTFKPFWRQSTYWYDGDAVPDRQKLYPFMKSSTNYQEPMGQISSYFQNKNIYFNILYSYPSAPLPLTSSMYKKINGVIQVDGSDERDFIDYGINETQRSILNFHWEQNENHENDVVNPDQGPYKHWIHEAFLAVYGGYAHYSNAVYSLRTFAGSNDISNTINGPYKTCWMLRTTNESNSWSGNYRPMDRYTTKLYVVMGFMFASNVLWWAGWTGTYGFADDGGSINPVVNEGNPYPQAGVEGLESMTKNVHLGAERQSLAINYRIRALNRDYGLYGSTDKLCVFTDPLQIQPRAEIIGVGRLRGNVLDVLIAEPRLDAGETMIVTIGNTVNGTTFTRTLNAGGIKDPLWETFAFAGAGTLSPSQVWIQYTSVKGITVKKNGLHQDI
jgi:hypothetical protein